MALFSTKQNRQLYVVKSVTTDTPSEVGAIAVGTAENGRQLYFKYFGAGREMRTDLIDIKKIISAKYTSYEDMQIPLRRVQVALNENINDGAPVAGEDYVLRINIRQYIGMGDEDTTQKYGCAHAFADMTAANFYKVLAISLAKNLSREVWPLLRVYLGDTEVTGRSKADDLPDADAIIIEEAEQAWHLGTMPLTNVQFEVMPTEIRYQGDFVIWGEVEELDSTTTLENGRNIADLEYFCMGERADQYRGMGWPNVIPTKYLVDPTKAYNVIDIHYAFTDSNEGVQQSEKTITLVADTDTDLSELISGINDAITETTGITVTAE